MTPLLGLTIRPAEDFDCVAIYDLAFDPDLRAQSFTRNMVIFEQHETWYNCVRAAGTLFFLAVLDRRVVGFVRYEPQQDGSALCSIAIARGFRGRGIGSYLLRQTLPLAARIGSPIRANVRPSNEPSLRCFGAVGFATSHVAMEWTAVSDCKVEESTAVERNGSNEK